MCILFAYQKYSFFWNIFGIYINKISILEYIIDYRDKTCYNGNTSRGGVFIGTA